VGKVVARRDDMAPGTRDDGAMTEDAMIPLLSAVTRIACRQMTPLHLNALHASVEQASCLSARHDWVAAKSWV
jgi:hypothetical protein